MNRTTITSRIRRTSLPLLAATLASALVLVAPAGAAPEGPAVEVTPIEKPDLPGELIPKPKPDPEPADPSVELQAADTCDPEPGVDANAQIHDGPDRPHTDRIDWENLDTGDTGSIPSLSGFAGTGEGQVELVAVVKYPTHLVLEKFYGPFMLESDPVTVTVACEDEDENDEEEEEEEEDEEDDEDETEVEDEIVEATPTFTG